jgi:hypothetical protein
MTVMALSMAPAIFSDGALAVARKDSFVGGPCRASRPVTPEVASSSLVRPAILHFHAFR